MSQEDEATGKMEKKSRSPESNVSVSSTRENCNPTQTDFYLNSPTYSLP